MAEGRYRFANGRDIITDAMAPEGVKVAPPGSLYLQENGDVWRKDTGTGNVGWVLIGDGGGGGTPSDYDLDYLGAYVPATQYLDGDIIIAEDGVAYVCVRDTVNPPTPWPGVGMVTAVGPPGPPGPKGDKGDPGTNAAVDATYWLSSGHPQLVNAQNFGIKPSGYVKSAVAAGYATPNIVAIIPISDGGTGASNAPQARINLGLGTMAVQNADAVAITGGTVNATHSGDGAGLVNLNASALAFGLVPSPQLGSGTANAGTYLRGDRTWAPVPSADAFPSGLIVMSVSPCPPGWTQINWGGYFLRVVNLGGPVNTAAGSDTHAHGLGGAVIPDHTHGPGSYAAANHDHPPGGTVWGTTDPAGTHRHGFGVHTVSGPNNIINLGGIPQGPVSYTPNTHTHTVDHDGETADGGSHSHGFAANFGIPAQAPAVTGQSGGSGAFGGVGGVTDTAANIPVHVNVYVCMKN